MLNKNVNSIDILKIKFTTNLFNFFLLIPVWYAKFPWNGLATRLGPYLSVSEEVTARTGHQVSVEVDL